MTQPQQPWIIENDIVNVLAAGIGCVVLGAAITVVGWLLKDAPDYHRWIYISMVLVGLFSFFGGVWMLVAMPRETTRVDPERKEIVVTVSTRFSEKKRVIRFSQIEILERATMGDNESGSQTFHVSAQLSNGEGVALFAAHYDGAKDHQVAEDRRQRLGTMILAAYPSKAATLLPAQRTLFQRVKDWHQGR